MKVSPRDFNLHHEHGRLTRDQFSDVIKCEDCHQVVYDVFTGKCRLECVKETNDTLDTIGGEYARAD